MTIPIQNLYFLLSYAWNFLDEDRVVGVSQEDMDTSVDLFARILEASTNHVLKRGLDRDYIETEIDVPGIKGKVDFNETLQRNLLSIPRVHCAIDDFTYNIPHNQILKTTLGRIVRCCNVERDRKDRLLRLYRRLHEIEDIALTPRTFASVRLHRNNAHYRLPLQVCRLIHDSVLISETAGEYMFRDFLRDEVAMRRLFEHFVFNFFCKEQSAFKVCRDEFHWQDVTGTEEALRSLPVMKTDISLESSDRKIIIDTKYYQKTLQQSQFGKQTVHSGNLYQLYAYVRNIELKEKSVRPVEGILLYPVTSKAVSLNYELQGHRMRIVTVDLNRDWREVHAQLLALIA